MAHNILIVDDSATVRAMLKKVLALIDPDLGEVYQAGDGIEALTQMALNLPDLILIDINMPTMSGIELLEQMRRSPELLDIPAVVISTKGSEQQIESVMQYGVAGYLRKPFRPEQLRDVLVPVLRLNNDTSKLQPAGKCDSPNN